MICMWHLVTASSNVECLILCGLKISSSSIIDYRCPDWSGIVNNWSAQSLVDEWECLLLLAPGCPCQCLEKVVASPDFGRFYRTMRCEGVHGVMGDTKDFQLFLERDDCITDGDLRIITGLVRLRSKQGNWGLRDVTLRTIIAKLTEKMHGELVKLTRKRKLIRKRTDVHDRQRTAKLVVVGRKRCEQLMHLCILLVICNRFKVFSCSHCFYGLQLAVWASSPIQWQSTHELVYTSTSTIFSKFGNNTAECNIT